ncbi:MAG: PEP-CTERM sorting domain-containing protein [Phycisphaerae bacterium]
MSKLTLLLAMCAVLAFGTAATGDLLVYEGFDYEAGALGGNGSSADAGWGGSWGVWKDDGRSVQVLDEGLSFGSLVTGGTSLRLQASVAASYDRYNRAYRALAPDAEVEGTVWHSHLLNIEPVKRTLDDEGELVTDPIENMESRWEARVDVDSTGDTDRTGSPDVAGFAGTRDGADLGRLVVAESSQNATGTAPELDTTYLVLGKVDGIGGTEPVTFEQEDPDTGEMVEVDGYRYRATMWVLTEDNFAELVNAGWDESVLDTEHVQFATKTVDSTILATFSDEDWVQLHTRDWGHDGFSPLYDELRYGTDLESVTPIPEPATLALLATGGVGVAMRRRR